MLAVYTVWDKNVLDGLDAEYASAIYHDSTGRFAPYWTRFGTIIDHSFISSFENSDWYKAGKENSYGQFVEPRPIEVNGKNAGFYKECSICRR